MNPTVPFTLATSRLILRPLQPTDLVAFSACQGGPEEARYPSWESFFRTQAAEFLGQHGQTGVPAAPGTWAPIGIAGRRTNMLLGNCALQLYAHDPGTAEIGITLAPAVQGRGYAQEALHGLLHYCFAELKLQRVVAITDSLNLAAARLLERVGMRQEVHLRKNTWLKGAWGDEYRYVLLFDEWDSWQLQ
ncbi:GNAT family N-acetyltransferase [Hymenobacter cellulosivorans]|uniref:GNAT family N-acetyltransferase n=1 Tax=Hymenobacter cellulosivorans TaxID=2932249 RepID=A0ABY4F730_9BACT|nr:GNAT family protein [Hymenobacter cellulosivorans]UOQ52021.1 GNAT family N-acetyltransferase [Hymenobacter cellulosivorans]